MLPAKKTIYHSELCAACEQAEHGKLYVQLVGRPKQSKYPRGKATHYVRFLAWGDPEQSKHTPREYWIENAGILAALERVAVGEWVWIHAGGGAREAATIAVWNQAGALIAAHTPAEQPAQAAPAPARAPAPAAPAPAAPAPPSPAPSAPATQPVRHEAGPGMPRPANGNGNGACNGRRYDRETSLAEEMLECLRAAGWIAEEYGEPLPTEDLRAIAAALFIEYQRSGGARRILPEHVRKQQRAPSPVGSGAGSAFEDDDDLPF
ncbi:MAG TPA: hypothetical protein VF158_04285 [Longimicrobiales bacterium]